MGVPSGAAVPELCLLHGGGMRGWAWPVAPDFWNDTVLIARARALQWGLDGRQLGTGTRR